MGIYPTLFGEGRVIPPSWVAGLTVSHEDTNVSELVGACGALNLDNRSGQFGLWGITILFQKAFQGRYSSAWIVLFSHVTVKEVLQIVKLF